MPASITVRMRTDGDEMTLTFHGHKDPSKALFEQIKADGGSHSPTGARVMIPGDDGMQVDGGGHSVADFSLCGEPSLAEQVAADVLACFRA